MEHSPVQTPSPNVTEQEPETGMPNNELDGDLQTVVPDIPQWATKEEVASVEEEQNKNVPEEQEIIPQTTQDPGEPVEPVNEVEDRPPKKDVEDKDCEVEETKPQMNQVKFADSLILTSYKPPPPKKEKKEQSHWLIIGLTNWPLENLWFGFPHAFLWVLECWTVRIGSCYQRFILVANQLLMR